MPTIIVKTKIEVPIETCFDLARDIDYHCSTTSRTRERAVSGTTTGKINLGESVTFEAVHFDIRQRFTARVTEFERPHYFVDEMTKGAFKSMKHTHKFESVDTSTLMTHTLTWVSPFSVLGVLFDRILLERHMKSFIIERNAELKVIAEQESGRIPNKVDL